MSLGRQRRCATSSCGSWARIRARRSGGAAAAGAGQLTYAGSDRSRWLRGLATYREVRYRHLYPGIDARFYGRGARFQYDLVVAPGADPRRIGLDVRGAESVRLDGRGRLIIAVGGGVKLIQERPRAASARRGRAEVAQVCDSVFRRFVRDGLGLRWRCRRPRVKTRQDQGVT